MSLFDRVSEDIKKAMLARDKESLEALRGIKKEFLEAKTAKGATGELADDAALAVAVQIDFATDRFLQSGNHVHQYGFTGTVVAYDTMYLLGFKFMANVVQHFFFAKTFIYMFYSNYDVAHDSFPIKLKL